MSQFVSSVVVANSDSEEGRAMFDIKKMLNDLAGVIGDFVKGLSASMKEATERSHKRRKTLKKISEDLKKSE